MLSQSPDQELLKSIREVVSGSSETVKPQSQSQSLKEALKFKKQKPSNSGRAGKSDDGAVEWVAKTNYGSDFELIVTILRKTNGNSNYVFDMAISLVEVGGNVDSVEPLFTSFRKPRLTDAAGDIVKQIDKYAKFMKTIMNDVYTFEISL